MQMFLCMCVVCARLTAREQRQRIDVNQITERHLPRPLVHFERKKQIG